VASLRDMNFAEAITNSIPDFMRLSEMGEGYQVCCIRFSLSATMFMAVSIFSRTCVGATAIKMPNKQPHGAPSSQSTIEKVALQVDKWSKLTAR
jgi:hypothetical protein